jgi:hypothetical protein
VEAPRAFDHNPAAFAPAAAARIRRPLQPNIPNQHAHSTLEAGLAAASSLAAQNALNSPARHQKLHGCWLTLWSSFLEANRGERGRGRACAGRLRLQRVLRWQASRRRRWTSGLGWVGVGPGATRPGQSCCQNARPYRRRGRGLYSGNNRKKHSKTTTRRTASRAGFMKASRKLFGVYRVRAGNLRDLNGSWLRDTS